MIKTKICKSCGEEKDVSEFYKRRETKDKLGYECKECKKLYSREVYKYKYKNKDVTRGQYEAPSTTLAKKELEKHGIVVITAGGKSYFHSSVNDLGVPTTYCDLIAWGCIPIEAKLTTQSKWQWGLTSRQRNIPFYGIYVLMAVENNITRYFVLPHKLAWFLDDAGRPNKTSIVFSRTHEDDLLVFENKWDYIEEYRQEIVSRLLLETLP